MKIGWLTGVGHVPAQRLDDAVTFWASVTATSPRAAPRADGSAAEDLASGSDTAYLRLQVVDGPPRWQLAVGVDDPVAAIAAAVELGATTGPDPATSFLSPAGLEVIVAAAPAPWPAGPRPWPGGPSPLDGPSRLDQICLDIQAAAFEAEAAFWPAFTGRPRRPSTLPEFDYLPPGAGLPIRLLLQRLGAGEIGPARAHVDLACHDRGAEQARHIALGARITRTTAEWTTLLDPAGLTYCITDRPPA